MGPTCSECDFSIRCLPEDVIFEAEKAKLVAGSEVFADMFSCCDNTSNEDSMDIHESSVNIAILVRLLHKPPPALLENVIKSSDAGRNATPSVIPYLLLPQLFALAEKYGLKPSIMEVLETHLAAQAPAAPLLVYGLAIQYSLPDIADRASEFLVSQPLEAYSTEEIKVIPSAEAYHKLLKLQTYRKGKIKQLLMDEELFPHGYGACSIHRAYAEITWDQKRRRLFGNIDSGTNVGVRMSHHMDAKTRQCKTCRKAWNAASEMLAYRCRRVAHRLSQLPSEDGS